MHVTIPTASFGYSTTASFGAVRVRDVAMNTDVCAVAMTKDVCAVSEDLLASTLDAHRLHIDSRLLLCVAGMRSATSLL